MCTLLIAALVAATPTPPTGGTDQVIGIAYAPQAAMSGNAMDLAGSAASTIYFATWKLGDTAVTNALCLASSRGVQVRVVLDLTGGTGTLQHQLARQIVASGGTCWNASFPSHVANNFLAADGNYTLQGNYYWSPNAIQTGSYLVSVSGTNAAAAAVATFNTLISGGTITAFNTHSTILDAPPLSQPTVIYADDPTPTERPRFHRRAMVLPRPAIRQSTLRTVRDAARCPRLAGLRAASRRRGRRGLAQCPQCQYGNCQQQQYRPVDDPVGYPYPLAIGPPPAARERVAEPSESVPLELAPWTRPGPKVCERASPSGEYRLQYADPVPSCGGRYSSAGVVSVCQPAAIGPVRDAWRFEAWTTESQGYRYTPPGWVETSVRLRMDERNTAVYPGMRDVEPPCRPMPLRRRLFDARRRATQDRGNDR